MFKFLTRYEFFGAGCDHERYAEFLRRWESNRADFEGASSMQELLVMLSERLTKTETATIKADKNGQYLTVKGPDWAYTTRIYARGGANE